MEVAQEVWFYSWSLWILHLLMTWLLFAFLELTGISYLVIGLARSGSLSSWELTCVGFLVGLFVWGWVFLCCVCGFWFCLILFFCLASSHRWYLLIPWPTGHFSWDKEGSMNKCARTVGHRSASSQSRRHWIIPVLWLWDAKAELLVTVLMWLRLVCCWVEMWLWYNEHNQ